MSSLSDSGYRGIIPPLSRRAWRLLFGNTLSQIGTGMTFPFLMIFLHEARHINLSTAGLVLATSSAAGLLTIPLAGRLVDRFGTGPTVVSWLLVSAVGSGSFFVVHSAAGAFFAAFVFGTGTAGMWNSISAMFAEVVPADQRSAIFGVSYALQNLGLGLGAAGAGMFVAARPNANLPILFLIDAASYLVFGLVLVLSGEVRLGKRRETEDPGPVYASAVTGDRADGHAANRANRRTTRRATGYREVLSDRRLIGITVLNTLLASVLVTELNVAFPIWAVDTVRVPAYVVGFAFLGNTSIIIVGQLLVLHFLLRGRRRTRAAAFAASVFGAACLLTFLSAEVPGGMLRESTLVVSLTLFGFGETLLAPSLAPLINDIAPELRRGRYNAVFNASWQVGPLIGPVLAGLALGHQLGGVLFASLAAVSAMAVMLALRLERVVPEEMNRGGLSG